MEMLEHGEGNSHRRDGERRSDEGSREHEEEFSEDQVHAGDGTGENGFHGAAFFFAGGEIHGGYMPPSGRAE